MIPTYLLFRFNNFFHFAKDVHFYILVIGVVKKWWQIEYTAYWCKTWSTTASGFIEYRPMPAHGRCYGSFFVTCTSPNREHLCTSLPVSHLFFIHLYLKSYSKLAKFESDYPLVARTLVCGRRHERETMPRIFFFFFWS